VGPRAVPAARPLAGLQPRSERKQGHRQAGRPLSPRLAESPLSVHNTARHADFGGPLPSLLSGPCTTLPILPLPPLSAAHDAATAWWVGECKGQGTGTGRAGADRVGPVLRLESDSITGREGQSTLQDPLGPELAEKRSRALMKEVEAVMKGTVRYQKPMYYQPISHCRRQGPC